MSNSITIKAQCPHCGALVAVLVDANVSGAGHTVARCDDGQDGGCDRPFVVTYEISVDTTTTKLYDDIWSALHIDDGEGNESWDAYQYRKAQAEAAMKAERGE